MKEIIIDKSKIADDISKIAERWDPSRIIGMYREGAQLYKGVFGYADRENGVPMNERSTFCVWSGSAIFIGLSLLLLRADGALSFEDTIDRFIPAAEYRHSDKIKIKHLARMRSGIPDYICGRLIRDLVADPAHSSLEPNERLCKERLYTLRNAGYSRALQLVGNDELEFAPDARAEYSQTNFAFLAEIIERASGMKLMDFIEQRIFAPLGIEGSRRGNSADAVGHVCSNKRLWRIELPADSTGLLTLSFEDCEKLALALTDDKLCPEEAWREALDFDSEGCGIVFTEADGQAYIDASAPGCEICFYIDRPRKTCFFMLSNEENIIRLKNGLYRFFKRELRNYFSSVFIYPAHTRMEKLSGRNIWDAMDLSIKPEQEDFVMDARSAIALASTKRKAARVFVEKEGGRAIGLLILTVDAKTNDYGIETVLIDRRYQGRGFGRIMLQWALKYLKRVGARELYIGVNRHNVAAQNLYKSLGFVENSIYDEGMELRLKL